MDHQGSPHSILLISGNLGHPFQHHGSERQQVDVWGKVNTGNTPGLLWWLRWESILQCRRLGFSPWVGKIRWRRAWQPSPVFLPGESHGQRSMGGYSIGSPRVGHDWATKNSTNTGKGMRQKCACSGQGAIRKLGWLESVGGGRSERRWAYSSPNNHVSPSTVCGVVPREQLPGQGKHFPATCIQISVMWLVLTDRLCEGLDVCHS